MSDALIDGYARALFEVARAEGTLDEVEDELFRFARSYESSDALRNALTDEQSRPPSARPSSRTSSAARPRRPRSSSCRWWSAPAAAVTCPRSSTGSSQRASSAKQLDLAEVRTAVALTDDQQARLKAALANATGKSVNLKVDRRPHRARRPRRHRR